MFNDLHNIINIHEYDFTFMTEVPFHDFGKIYLLNICFSEQNVILGMYLINSTLFNTNVNTLFLFLHYASWK